MLLASDVMACCTLPPSAAVERVEAEVTPRGAECAKPLKRQRPHDNDDSDCSTQQQWEAPASAKQPTWDALPSAQQPAACAVPWQASYLLDYVHRCLDALTAMHPVCAFLRTHTKAAELSCAIFRHVSLQYSRQEQAALARELFVAQALLAASLWIAIKWEATRTTTPDSLIMSRITGVPAAFLRQLEGKALAALRWDLMSLAREVGAVGAPDLSDAPALDQQAQLAALAQPPVLRWPTALASELAGQACGTALPPGLLPLSTGHAGCAAADAVGAATQFSCGNCI